MSRFESSRVVGLLPRGTARRYIRVALLAALGAVALCHQASAGTGCDLNIRVNNKSPNAVTVYGASHSSASKAGLGLWSPISGMQDAVLDPEGSGADSHTRQAIELALPCWTGNVDFKIKYLDGTIDKWKYRYGVGVSAGATIQINIP